MMKDEEREEQEELRAKHSDSTKEELITDIMNCKNCDRETAELIFEKIYDEVC